MHTGVYREQGYAIPEEAMTQRIAKGVMDLESNQRRSRLGPLSLLKLGWVVHDAFRVVQTTTSD
jgi:hypothetical protein